MEETIFKLVEQQHIEHLSDVVTPMEHETIEVSSQELIDYMISLFERVKVHGLVESPQSLSECDIVINLQRDEDAFEVEVEVKVRRETFTVFLHVIHPLHYQVHCMT